MRNALFIAWHDFRQQMKQGATLLWVFVMPPIFFYFIGTVTGGFSSGMGGGSATPLVIEADSPGFVQDLVDRRLRENDFEPEWREPQALGTAQSGEDSRTLFLPQAFSEKIIAGEQFVARYDTSASALSRDYEQIRITRGLYTVLADIVVVDALSPAPLTAAALEAHAAEPKIWQLRVEPAGKRSEIPTGFEQAIPGTLVMFTLLVLLTSGASALVVERTQGLFRRLAAAPLSRAEIIYGKWGGRMGLAALQVGAALVIGTLFFKMNWGPNPGMVLVVLGAWAAFCASAGLLLGNLATTEGQATGLGVLLANLLAALGGCWWPIEVTPQWMQSVQKMLPTGWTMDALHKLISFEAGAASAIPQVFTLLLATLVVSTLAIRRFRYE